jgi:hypothetical protein
MSARSEVVTLLTAVLPSDIDVIGYARDIDAPTASTVMVRLDRVVPSPAGQGLRIYEIALVLIGAKTTAGPADDEVDALLEDVLFALSRNEVPNGVTWTEARRATYGEPDGTNPAYELALQVTIATSNPEPTPFSTATTTQ